jgi:hypothetical protein
LFIGKHELFIRIFEVTEIIEGPIGIIVLISKCWWVDFIPFLLNYLYNNFIALSQQWVLSIGCICIIWNRFIMTICIWSAASKNSIVTIAIKVIFSYIFVCFFLLVELNIYDCWSWGMSHTKVFQIYFFNDIVVIWSKLLSLKFMRIDHFRCTYLYSNRSFWKLRERLFQLCIRLCPFIPIKCKIQPIYIVISILLILQINLILRMFDRFRQFRSKPMSTLIIVVIFINILIFLKWFNGLRC